MMQLTRRRRGLRRLFSLIAGALGITLVVLGASAPADAASYIKISGEGSSWAGAAMQQWQSDVAAQGVKIGFTPNGSSIGRSDFAQSLNGAQFAVSEIPYKGDTADPQDVAYPNFKFMMLPVVSGGTAFMYNIKIGDKQVTNLNLSQAAIAGIFTGQITMWNDPAIQADNPGLALPAHKITVVVRSEGSGASAQFTLWLLRQFPTLWAAVCHIAGCDPTHGTSYYPHDHLDSFIAQNGSSNVTTYVVNTGYSIGYDEYAYALGQRLGKGTWPVANVKNAAGYYTKPDQYAVAVAMTQAKINLDQSDPNYLSQDLSGVYEYKDPRTYPLSMYTYEIAPTETHNGGTFNNQVGATLGYFDQYALCEGQRTMGANGYSPLPMNLVLAALDQVKRIPGVDKPTLDKIAATGKAVSAGTGNPCNNPTFKPGDSPSVNQLVRTAPFPPACTTACQAPWAHTSGTNTGPNAPGGNGGGNSGGGSNSNNPGTNNGNSSNGGNSNNGGNTGGGATGGGANNAGGGSNGGNNNTGGANTVDTNGDGVPDAPAGAGGGKQSCDPDTGVCTTTGGGGTGGTDGAINAQNAGNITAAASVINGQQGWAGPQSLMVIIGLLILAGLFAPAAIGRLLRSNGGRR